MRRAGRPIPAAALASVVGLSSVGLLLLAVPAAAADTASSASRSKATTNALTAPAPDAAGAARTAGGGLWQQLSQPFELHVELQNISHFRNDSDFDRTPPLYDDNGQTVGVIGTVLRPQLTLRVLGERLRIYYEAEIGLNYWSKQNPDQLDPLATDVFVFRQREIYGQGELLGGGVGFKVGYQYFRDPSGLFLGKWMGVAQAQVAFGPRRRPLGLDGRPLSQPAGGGNSLSALERAYQTDQAAALDRLCLPGSAMPLDRSRASLFVGQVPDQVYEGVDVLDNNFRRDIFVFGGRLDLVLPRDLRLSLALPALYDSHITGQTRWLLAPVFHLEGSSSLSSSTSNASDDATDAPSSRGGHHGHGAPRLHWFVEAMLQAGRFQGSALDGGDQRHLAWAAQAHVALGAGRRQRLTLDWNLMLLSPDDAHQGNATHGAFLYSGKAQSATVMLTEDELRDWYDSLDRRVSSFEGGFYVNRAGLMVTDLRASLRLGRYLRPALIAGVATVLEPENALGGRLVAVETDVLLEVRASRHLALDVLVGVLLPGAAGAALINRIDLAATCPIYLVEVSLMLRY